LKGRPTRRGAGVEPDRTRFDEDAEPAGAFRLRSEPPPVMRLSRRVLTGLVGIGAIVIFGALIFALSQGSRRSGGGSELYNTDNKTTPDGLSTLPRDGRCRRSLARLRPATPPCLNRCRVLLKPSIPNSALRRKTRRRA
jgi:hypothetical protein